MKRFSLALLLLLLLPSVAIAQKPELVKSLAINSDGDGDAETLSEIELTTLKSSGHSAVTLSGTADYLSLSGQQITRNAINLGTAANVTGTLPDARVADDITLTNITQITNRAHSSLGSLQGGTTGEYYHVTSAQHTDLTDGGDSTLHYHAADRNPANLSAVVPADKGGLGTSAAWQTGYLKFTSGIASFEAGTSGVNLGDANVWTGAQTFAGGVDGIVAGTEMVLNGTCTDATNWTLTGTWRANGAGQLVFGDAGSYAQGTATPALTGAIEAGRVYRVRFDYQPVNGGSITFSIGGASYPYSGPVSLDANITAVNTNGLVFTNGSGSNAGGAIDNVSVMPVATALNVTSDLTVDGGDIGLTADPDLIGLASGALSVRGTLATGGNVTIGANDTTDDVLTLGGATLTYNEASDRFDTNKAINVTGALTASGTTSANGGLTVSSGNITHSRGTVEGAYTGTVTSDTDANNYKVTLQRGRASGANVAENDTLGTIYFKGVNTSSYVTAAAIKATVNGTPGAADMPGEIGLYTTPDGGATALKRISANNKGATTLSNDADGLTLLTLDQNDADQAFIKFDGTDAVGGQINQTEKSTFARMIQVDVGGTKMWLKAYAD